MNVPMKMIDDAFEFILSDSALMTMLYDTYLMDLGIPGTPKAPFNGYIRESLDRMAKGFAEPYAAGLALAMRIAICGDALAVLESIDAKAHGFNSDVNCYVQEDVIHSEVFVKHFDAKTALERAERIAENFRKTGYCTDLHVGEEDPRCVTVNAQIDFKIYRDLWMSGRIGRSSSIYRTNMV